MTEASLTAENEVPLFVYSGDVRQGQCGTDAGFTDIDGKPLRVGDIVLAFTDDYSPRHLSAVVQDGDQIYVMGLRSVPMDAPGEWRVRCVKPWECVLVGEHWDAWGFHYERE